MAITDFVSSAAVRNRQRYWNTAGWDFINIEEEAYVFIRRKTRDFAGETVAIPWVNKKYKNLFFPRDMSVEGVKEG